MKIGEVVKAVVLNNGTIQGFATNNKTVRRMVQAAEQQLHKDIQVKEVVFVESGETNISWLVSDENMGLVGRFKTRATARTAHLNCMEATPSGKFAIERVEYLILKREKVS